MLPSRDRKGVGFATGCQRRKDSFSMKDVDDGDLVLAKLAKVL
jgi:hypothetical protein